MPAPSVAAATSNVIASGTVLTLTKPGTPAVGDLLVACVGDYDVSNTITPPGGWTERTTTDHTGTEATYTTLFERVVDGTEGATLDFNFGGSANYLTGAMLLVTGADTSAPYDTHASAASRSSTAVDLPAVTTTVADTLLLSFQIGYNAAVSVAPSGWTQQVNWDTVCYAWSRSAASAGVQGSWAFTLASLSTLACAVVAYKPPGGGPSTVLSPLLGRYVPFTPNYAGRL